MVIPISAVFVSMLFCPWCSGLDICQPRQPYTSEVSLKKKRWSNSGPPLVTHCLHFFTLKCSAKFGRDNRGIVKLLFGKQKISEKTIPSLKALAGDLIIKGGTRHQLWPFFISWTKVRRMDPILPRFALYLKSAPPRQCLMHQILAVALLASLHIRGNVVPLAMWSWGNLNWVRDPFITPCRVTTKFFH